MVIGARDVAREDRASVGQPDARGHVQVLDGNRHAEQWRQLAWLGSLGGHALRLARLFAREVGDDREKGADLRAEAVDPLQVVIENFGG